ncbi:ring finger protein-like [Anolis carolinensis]|uniref:ring finger protein-like n=1 Tax=Anolis carolinensis TaxID=28377 RepID=UPI002F2B6C0A
MEAAGLCGQEVKLEGKKALPEAEMVVPMVSCPPGQGGSIMAEEEDGEEKDRRAEEREPLLGLTVSLSPSRPDLEGPLRSANIAEAGQGLALGDSTGAETLVGTLKDAVLQRGQQGETEEIVNKHETTEEETKEEEEGVALESCCIQMEEPLEEVELEEEEEGAAVALDSPCIPVEEEPECPICTEPYDQEAHRPAPLNCGHVLCGRCLRAILEAGSAADIGRVRCPICRQKTPMMEWEICRLQEELLLLGASEGPAQETPAAASLLFRPLPPRRPGFWGGLEHRFRVRFLTSRTVGCLPCLRYPPGLVLRLERLEGRCKWGFRLALLALTAADALSLLLVFLPIALLLLLFLIMDQ